MFDPIRAAVLVIGGTGLMGAPTVRQLLEQGKHVVVLSRGSAKGQGIGGHRPMLPQGIEMIHCDRSDFDLFHKILVEQICPQIIVDFTAMKPDHIKSILAAHKERPLQHYIFVSTNMVYPGGPEHMDISLLEQPVAEDAADLEAASSAPDTYGGLKLKCEALLKEAFDGESFPFTTVRPPAVVGPGCDSRHEKLQRFVCGLPALSPRLRPPKLAARMGRFRVAFSEDVASVIALIVSRGKLVHGQKFNIACKEAPTMQEYTDELARAIPGTAEAQLPADANLRNYERQGCIDISKAEEVLGFTPTPLAECLLQTVRWHNEFLQPTHDSG